MKGISPVIATVLLLLMAVASVGGAWIWYQRQSAVVGGRTEEKIGEQVEQQAGAAVSLAGLYKSGNQTGLIINNAATNNITITGYIVVNATDTVVNTSVPSVLGNLGPQMTDQLMTTVKCTSGNEVTVQLFAAGMSTQKYKEDCP